MPRASGAKPPRSSPPTCEQSWVPIPAAVWPAACAALVALALGGCGGSTATRPVADAPDQPSPPVASAPRQQRGGGYYLNDGPGDNPPANLDQIPDAVPRAEPLHRGAMRPYTVMGRGYTPMTQLAPYRARGVATWYGRRYHGQRTSSGEVYDMYGMTAAHTTLPIPSYVRVTNPRNGRSVIVRINDRGPFIGDRLIDLSYTAAHRLDILAGGSAVVEVEAILPDSFVPDTSTTVAAVTAPAGAPARAPVPPDRRVVPVPRLDTVAATSAPPAAGNIFLQLGAFGVRENAERFAERMRTELEGLGAELRVFAADQLHRVQAGPFASRGDADAAAARIAERLGSQPIVTVR